MIKAKIHYYCRERQYHAMQFAAVEGMKRFSGDPAFKFFFGMALVLEGQLQEGIRELDSLQNYSEVQLGSLLALIHAHKKCQPVDKEAVLALDAKLKEERKRGDDQALLRRSLPAQHRPGGQGKRIRRPSVEDQPPVKGGVDPQRLDGGGSPEGEQEQECLAVLRSRPEDE